MAQQGDSPSGLPALPHRRRARYGGTHPRQFEQRYKELDPEAYPQEHQRVRARGRTPAGTHVPILLAEVVRHLAPGPGDIVADCTLGYGGHAEVFIRGIGPTGRLVGFDVDGEQLERTGKRLAGLSPSLSLHRGNFAGIAKALAADGIEGFDVIFADLGVSSMQLDDPARGFSYKHDGPLDMRMDRRRVRSAAEVLATISRDELTAALADLADEEAAGRIAAALVHRRRTAPILRTLELAELVLAAKGYLGSAGRRHKVSQPEMLHPAALTFLALRILVNDELGSLRQLLRDAPGCLRAGGRIGILTFHSGEDRLVKQAFRAGHRDGAYDKIAEDVIRPTAQEIASNPRSRPAKFRWAHRPSA